MGVVVLSILTAAALRSARTPSAGSALASAVPSPSASASSPQSGQPTLLYVTFGGPSSQTSDIVAFDAVGGTSTVLASVSHAIGYNIVGWISPSRSKIALSIPISPAKSALAIMPTGGGPLTTVDTNAVVTAESPPAWSPDDLTISYLRSSPSGMDVVAYDVIQNSSKVQFSISKGVAFLGRLGSNYVALTTEAGGSHFSLFSATGQETVIAAAPADFAVPVQYASNLIVFGRVNSAGGLAVASASATPGSAVSQLATGTNDTWSVSADGSHVALSDWSAWKAGVSRIRVVTLGPQPSSINLPTTPGRLAQPVSGKTWSADFVWIGVESDDAAHARGIELLRADGSGLRFIGAPAGGSLQLVGWR